MTDNPYNNENDKPSKNSDDEIEPSSKEQNDAAPPKKYIHPPAEPNGNRPRAERRDTEKTDYEVGYKKPPKKHQFQKGQSGNKKGRPKGRRDFRTDLEANLNSRVKVNKDGKQVKLSRQELIIEGQTTRAVKGDPKSASIIFDLIARYLFEDPNAGAEKPITAEEQQILEAFAARFSTTPNVRPGEGTAASAGPEPNQNEQTDVSTDETISSNEDEKPHLPTQADEDE